MATSVEKPRPLPVALFEFDEGEGAAAHDSTGGPPAAVNGASWSEGKFGGALKLGAGENAEVENTDALQMNGGLTIEAWLDPEAPSGERAVISKTDPGAKPGEEPDSYSLTLSGTGVPTFKLRTHAGTYAELSATNPLPVGSWSQLTITAGTSWIAMYVDGERVAGARSSVPTSSTGPLEIGSISGAGFRGRIDHLKLYDESLTEKEVRADAAYAGPAIELSGPATEFLPEPPAGEYELHIASTEGAKGRTEPGVTALSVSVDGGVQKAFRQECAESNCSFETAWGFEPLKFSGLRHTVTVVAEDKAGTLMARSYRATTAAENIRTCSVAESGAAVSSESEPGLGGGTTYRYSLGEVHGRAPVPPSGFDPLKASQAELAEYDFPPRPAASEELAAWEATFAGYEGTEGGGPPNPCASKWESNPHEAGVNPKNVNSSQERSPIWAGYAAYEYFSPDYFRNVEGKITQPQWHADKCPEAEETSWVGLGGVGGGSLIQDGTILESNEEIRGFYEWLGANEGEGIAAHAISPKRLDIDAGDKLYIQSSYVPSENRMIFFIWDQSKPKQMPFAEDFQGAWTKKFYEGEFAEWIDERPTVNGKPVGLRNFRQIQWSEARAENKFGKARPIGDWNHARFNMRAESGSSYAEPSPLRAGNARFTEHWLRCGS